ncbi:MAG: type IV secretion system protein, partial [Afipia sp.]|nr:type IV secretion system protein [Afipia sp.]
MECPQIITGDRFLLRVLEHIDCQAQVLGSYGFQTLGQPGSLAVTVMAALLTLFVALFGLRLLFGPAPHGRDVVYDVLKIGIVLTLAFSWPAFRTVIHDVVLKGPAEVTALIAAPGSFAEGTGFAQRLQDADNAMVRLTEVGTGRNTGAILESGGPGATFAGTALQDDAAFGYGRLLYLAGIMGSLILLRLVAGLLLALAPLAAGLLLFEQTRGLFSGWLRGLVLAVVGTVGVTIVLGVELALLEPWLADAARLRSLGYATPSAPIELFALTLAFALVQGGIIWLLAKIAFTRGWQSAASFLPAVRFIGSGQSYGAPSAAVRSATESRAERISDSVASLIRREEGASGGRTAFRAFEGSRGDGGREQLSVPGAVSAGTPRLGSSYRRTTRRSSGAGTRRD